MKQHLNLLLLFCLTFSASIAQDTAVVEDVVPVYSFEKIATVETGQVRERKISEYVLNEMRKDEDFWYANELPQRSKPPRNYSLPAFIIQLLWYLVIACFLAIVAWFIISSDIRLFRSKPRKINAGDHDKIVDVHEVDLEKQLSTAIANGDYRLGTRLLYLQLLKELSNKNSIQYHPYTTNREYLRQMSSSPHYKEFFRLTRSFEYIWYGGFNISENAFKDLKQEFNDFKKQYS